MIFRQPKQQDLPRLTEIYNQAIKAGQTAHTVQQSISDRKGWFESHLNKAYPLIIAEVDSEVIGYATISKYREARPAVQKTIEVSYYLHESHHRKGYGTRLLAHTLQVARDLEYENALAILLDTNAGSIRLLEKFGFEQWAYLPNIAKVYGVVCGQYIYGRQL